MSRFTTGIPSRCWLLVACLFSLPLGAVAQESEDAPEDEYAQELQERIDEAGNELDYLKRQTSHIERRIKLLSETRRIHLAIVKAETRIETTDDDQAREAIERELEELEIKMGRQEVRLDFHEERGELIDLLSDLNPPVLKPTKESVIGILRDMKKAEAFIEAGYQRLIAGADEKDRVWEAIEDRRDEFERKLESVVEPARLQRELFWAREEGEEELVEELEAELREVLELQKRSSREFDEGAAIDQAALPIEVSEQDYRAATSLDYQADVVSLLTNYCGDCHSGPTSSGDLDLNAITPVQPLVVNREHWVNIIQQIKVRSMPPEDAELPTDAERRQLVAWLTHAIETFDYESVRRVGYEPARRLTREEYNNTIRDLVGIDLRPADRFPADMTATSGFRNSANSLFFQPITLERFVGAAELVIDQAFPLDPQNQEQRDAWRKLLGEDSKILQPIRIIERFAFRAFRRPVEESELNRLVKHYEQRIAENAKPREAIQDVLKVVLISPAFLIRSETFAGTKKITEYELATRLSYFLWASTPDDELLKLAAVGRLSNSQTLKQQVDRMLDDPRSQSLGSVFASEWFGTHSLDRARPDQIEHPWATDALVDAMKLETSMLFATLVREDLPIERLVDADFTYLNEELARHYGRDDVEGPQMQRVSLDGTARRGLLGHASVLAVTSFPGRASPVLRGNWILSELLGTPPPPPPPNVSQFDERVAESERLTQRQKLQLHRRNPNCYACHSQIDPLGFTLSEFDWFGRYRTRGRRDRVDTSGQLPDGTTVNGLSGLAEVLTTDRVDDLSRQATTKLFSYALGRQLEYYDEASVRELLSHFESNDRRLRSLVHGIVQTNTFQSNDFAEQTQ